MLKFEDGKPFTSGVTHYTRTGSDISTRLNLEVLINEQLTTAIVDTGAPYFICSQEVAEQLDLKPEYALSNEEILIRGVKVKGGLHRVTLTIYAMEGSDIELEVTSFVPLKVENYGANFPSFLGFAYCLE